MHIVIFRSDNIGDLIHTLPLIGALKASIPSCKLTYIGRSYVEDLVYSSSQIDTFISLEFLEGLNDSRQISFFKEQKIDSILMLKRHTRILSSARSARIPHIIYQIKNYFFLSRSQRLLRCRIINANFRQGQTRIHYFERCLKFLKAYDVTYSLDRTDIENFIRLKTRFSEKVNAIVSQTSPNLLIHLGTNGNTQEWPLDRFKDFVAHAPPDVTIFFTGSQKERERFKEILSVRSKAVDLFDQLSLSEFVYLLSQVDCVLANATGPLHVAAALGTRTVGIYPAQSTIDTIRWGPIGKRVATVSAPPCWHSRRNMACTCISKISVEDVYEKVFRSPTCDTLNNY